MTKGSIVGFLRCYLDYWRSISSNPWFKSSRCHFGFLHGIYNLMLAQYRISVKIS